MPGITHLQQSLIEMTNERNNALDQLETLSKEHERTVENAGVVCDAWKQAAQERDRLREENEQLRQLVRLLLAHNDNVMQTHESVDADVWNEQARLTERARVLLREDAQV